MIDFGIAKATQGSLTDWTVYNEFRHLIGTPEYMSPEQAEMSSLDIDTRTELYSLGGCYTMSTTSRCWPVRRATSTASRSWCGGII